MQLRVRQPLRERLADPRRTDLIASPPPQRHRRADVGELERPRAAEVRQLATEPDPSVAERLDTPTCVRLVTRSVAGRRRRQPPPPLEPTRRDPRRDAR